MDRAPEPDLWATGLRLPSTWVCRSEAGAPAADLILTSAPDSAVASGRVSPELVVRLTTTAVDEAVWLDDLLAELEELPGFEVEDEDLLELGPQDVGYLRYSHRGPPGSPELLSERWSWWCGGAGLTLTGTLAREDFEIWCDVFEEIAAGVDGTQLRRAG